MEMLLAAAAAGGVSLFDQLTTPGKPIYLTLRTHRGPLPLGGARGTLWIDERRIGEVLTGSDGYGYLKHTATATGTFELTARVADDVAQARLRVVDANDPTILFEMEALLWQLLRNDRENTARRVLKQVAADFELVYLCGLMGSKMARQFIRKHALPDRVILVGKDRNQMARLKKRGIRIFAVVGSAAFAGAARDFSARRLSFDKSPQARQVRNWDDLLTHLREETP
jgi:hypothetical protein